MTYARLLSRATYLSEFVSMNMIVLTSMPGATLRFDLLGLLSEHICACLPPPTATQPFGGPGPSPCPDTDYNSGERHPPRPPQGTDARSSFRNCVALRHWAIGFDVYGRLDTPTLPVRWRGGGVPCPTKVVFVDLGHISQWLEFEKRVHFRHPPAGQQTRRGWSG